MKLTDSLKNGLDYFVHDFDGRNDVFTLHYKQWWKKPVKFSFTRAITAVDKKTKLYTYTMSWEANELWYDLRSYLGWDTGDLKESLDGADPTEGVGYGSGIEDEPEDEEPVDPKD